MKKGNDRPLTEAIFISTIQELRETFAAKSDLKSTKEELKLNIVDLELKMNEKFEDNDKKSRGYRDEILTRIDSFAKRVVDLEEESEVGTFQIDKLLKKSADHEKRILKLETKKN